MSKKWYITTLYFQKQLNALAKKYPWVWDDVDAFFEHFSVANAASLWKWLYKCRIANSSLGAWKRWWFRVIVYVPQWSTIPILVRSKRDKETVTLHEIQEALRHIAQEFSL